MAVETKTSDESNLAQVEADLASIPFRQPIVDDYDPAIYDPRPGGDGQIRENRLFAHEAAKEPQNRKVELGWRAITASALRAIHSSPDVRRVAATFTVEPLSELLPQNAVKMLAESDPRVARLAERMGKIVGAVLGLRPVPDELLTPDLRNAPSLRRKEEETGFFVRTRADYPEDYDHLLQTTRRRVETHPGITSAERDLVARRYRYARDIKLLGLAAELQDQPIDRPEVKDGIISHKLKSGTTLVMTGEAFRFSPSLLDPQKWENRRQLKDRVHVVTVDGKNYIMKERKTSRHTDVKKGGHIDGLSSRQEFEVAKEFSDLGTIRQGGVELHWEKPLGYVEFPDGYQFCLFESEPGLQTEQPVRQLVGDIMASAEEYTQEFERTSERARQIYHERKDLLRGTESRNIVVEPKSFDFSKTSGTTREADQIEPDPDELTFKEFAELKAHYLMYEAEELLSNTMWDHDYTNSDIDGYAFRVHKGRQPIVEIIGFDFEYYQKDPEDAELIKQDRQNSHTSGISADIRAYRIARTRAIALAASYGMCEQMGWELPPQNYTFSL